MKKSPSTGDYSGYEFHFQEDFSQFLEEARKHAYEGKAEEAPTQEADREKKRPGLEKKDRKSWKESMLSWLNSSDKKKKLNAQQSSSSGTSISRPRRGYVSGPIHWSGAGITGRPRKPTSGPLSALLNPSRRAKDEIQYMCLGQLNNPHDVQAYGPVYLVT